MRRFNKTMYTLIRGIRRLYNNTKIPSTHMMVGAVLESRGLEWKEVEMEKVQSNSHSISFKEEWKKLIYCISAITGTTISKSTLTTALPWKYFEHVINPGRGYESEVAFSNSLFYALRTSLSNFIEPTITEANWIAFKNSPVRFGKGISRATLGGSFGLPSPRDILFV